MYLLWPVYAHFSQVSCGQQNVGSYVLGQATGSSRILDTDWQQESGVGKDAVVPRGLVLTSLGIQRITPMVDLFPRSWEGNALIGGHGDALLPRYNFC